MIISIIITIMIMIIILIATIIIIITMSTTIGIGGALIVNGNLFDGCSFDAGDFGHHTIW